MENIDINAANIRQISRNSVNIILGVGATAAPVLSGFPENIKAELICSRRGIAIFASGGSVGVIATAESRGSRPGGAIFNFGERAVITTSRRLESGWFYFNYGRRAGVTENAKSLVRVRISPFKCGERVSITANVRSLVRSRQASF